MSKASPAKQVEALMEKPTAIAFKATNRQGRPLHYPWADIVYAEITDVVAAFDPDWSYEGAH